MSERGRRIVANCLLLTGTLTIGLLVSELLVRWVLPQELKALGSWDTSGLITYDKELGHALRPNFEGPWAREVKVRVNSIGLRDREYGSRGKNEIRILSLGDSYAFGYGVELSQSYPKLVERMLSERFSSCRFFVINGAVSGYSTHQQILMFEKLYALLDPDFVLATFVGSNDVSENSIFLGQIEQKVLSPVGFLGQNSHLVRLVRRVSHPVTYRLSNWWGPNIDYTIELLQQLVGRFKTNNVPYLMLVIPARHQVRPEVNLASKWLFYLGLNDLIMRQNTAIISHFDNNDIPYLNLHPILLEHDKLERVSFVDDSHTNLVGHRLMAEAVYETIGPNIAELVGKKTCSSK